MKFLLIDDDDVTNFINKRILKNIYPDATIVTASNGIDALNVLTNLHHNGDTPFNAIFVDISMPEMDGWEFIDEVSKDTFSFLHRCCFFMLTSSVFDDDINKARSKPLIKRFYSKPLAPEKVKEIVTICNAKN